MTASGSPHEAVGGIDWPDVHRRLDAVRQILDAGSSRTRQQMSAVLRRRAVALARKVDPSGPEDDGLTISVVEFRVSRERHAVECAWVGEVLPLKHLAELPCAPPFVAGIISVRGHIISVIDVRRLFDLPRADAGPSSRVIVLRADSAEVGILADAVVGSRVVAVRDIQPELPTLTGVREEFLRGVADGDLVILDAERLLAAEKLIVNEEVP